MAPIRSRGRHQPAILPAMTDPQPLQRRRAVKPHPSRRFSRLATLMGVAVLAAACTAGTGSSATGTTTKVTSSTGSSTSSSSSSSSGTSKAAQSRAFVASLGKPLSGPHLAPGSNPSVLPGPILIADRNNSRLLIVGPHGRIRWEFPRPGHPAPSGLFIRPDDAFFSPGGHYIIATEESNFVIAIIDIATNKIVYHYGTPGVSGSGPNQLWNPDDAMLLPNHTIVAADIKNCRLIQVAPGAHQLQGSLGQPGTCFGAHNPPTTFLSPNGAFPMNNGNWLITEIGGDWVDEVTPHGRVIFSVNVPFLPQPNGGNQYPSDTNQIGPNRYLSADYTNPGQLVIFNKQGQALWRYDVTSGPGALNSPSLAMPLPNGDILLNDDYNHRVIVIDPKTNKIVWQYGVTGTPGTAPGMLDKPDGVDLAPPYSLLMTHRSTLRPLIAKP